jgi:hypothetical protein
MFALTGHGELIIVNIITRTDSSPTALLERCNKPADEVLTLYLRKIPLARNKRVVGGRHFAFHDRF